MIGKDNNNDDINNNNNLSRKILEAYTRDVGRGTISTITIEKIKFSLYKSCYSARLS